MAGLDVLVKTIESLFDVASQDILRNTMKHFSRIFSTLNLTISRTPQSVPYSVLGGVDWLTGALLSDAADQEDT